MDSELARERELMRRWVRTWRVAGEELEKIRRREIEDTDTREAIRQIFGFTDGRAQYPSNPGSGLVEQQALFARLRK